MESPEVGDPLSTECGCGCVDAIEDGEEGESGSCRDGNQIHEQQIDHITCIDNNTVEQNTGGICSDMTNVKSSERLVTDTCSSYEKGVRLESTVADNSIATDTSGIERDILEPIVTDTPGVERDILEPTVTDTRGVECDILEPTVTDTRGVECDILEPTVTDTRGVARDILEPTLTDTPGVECDILEPTMTDTLGVERDILKPIVTDTQGVARDILEPIVTDTRGVEFDIREPTMTDTQGVECDILEPTVTDTRGVECDIREPTMTDTQGVECDTLEPTVTDTRGVECDILEPTLTDTPGVECDTLEPIVTDTPRVECDILEPTVTDTPGVERDILEPTVTDTRGVESDILEPTVTDTPGVEHDILDPSVTDTSGVERDILEPTVTDTPGVERDILEPTVTDTQGVARDILEPIVTDTRGVECDILEPTLTDTPGVECDTLEPIVTDTPRVECDILEPTVTDTPGVERDILEPTVTDTPGVESDILEPTATDTPGVGHDILDPSVTDTSGVERDILEASVTYTPGVERNILEPTVTDTLGVELEPLVTDTPDVTADVQDHLVTDTPTVDGDVLETVVMDTKSVQRDFLDHIVTDTPTVDDNVVEPPGIVEICRQSDDETILKTDVNEICLCTEGDRTLEQQIDATPSRSVEQKIGGESVEDDPLRCKHENKLKIEESSCVKNEKDIHPVVCVEEIKPEPSQDDHEDADLVNETFPDTSESCVTNHTEEDGETPIGYIQCKVEQQNFDISSNSSHDVVMDKQIDDIACAQRKPIISREDKSTVLTVNVEQPDPSAKQEMNLRDIEVRGVEWVEDTKLKQETDYVPAEPILETQGVLKIPADDKEELNETKSVEIDTMVQATDDTETEKNVNQPNDVVTFTNSSLDDKKEESAIEEVENKEDNEPIDKVRKILGNKEITVVGFHDKGEEILVTEQRDELGSEVLKNNDEESLVNDEQIDTVLNERIEDAVVQHLEVDEEKEIGINEDDNEESYLLGDERKEACIKEPVDELPVMSELAQNEDEESQLLDAEDKESCVNKSADELPVISELSQGEGEESQLLDAEDKETGVNESADVGIAPKEDGEEETVELAEQSQAIVKRVDRLNATLFNKLTDVGRYSYGALCAICLYKLYGDCEWHSEFVKTWFQQIVNHLELGDQFESIFHKENSLWMLAEDQGISAETCHFVDSLIKEPYIEEQGRDIIPQDLIFLALKQGRYDARARTFIKYVSLLVMVSHDDVGEFEDEIVEILHEKEHTVTEEEEKEKRKSQRTRKVKKYTMIGLASVGGGALLGLTGGLCAPLIAAGAGALLGGAGATILGSTLGLALITSIFGVAGAGLAGFKMKKRVGDIEEFAFEPLTEGRTMHVTIAVPGWITKENPATCLDKAMLVDLDVKRAMQPMVGFPSRSNTHKDFKWVWMGLANSKEQYVLRYESKYLYQVGNAIDYFMRIAVGAAVNEALKYTVLIGILNAVIWPSVLISASGIIDNPWGVCAHRAKNVGKQLADVLLARHQGNRPVTLVGFSLGARVLFYCLQEMSTRKNCEGIVEDVILLGTPVTGDPKTWEPLARVVSGKIINGFCRSDWLLKFLYRTASAQYTIAGLAPVRWIDRRMCNIDLSDVVNGHLDYMNQVDFILDIVGVKTRDHPKTSTSPDTLQHWVGIRKDDKMGMISEEPEGDVVETGSIPGKVDLSLLPEDSNNLGVVSEDGCYDASASDLVDVNNESDIFLSASESDTSLSPGSRFYVPLDEAARREVEMIRKSESEKSQASATCFYISPNEAEGKTADNSKVSVLQSSDETEFKKAELETTANQKLTNIVSTASQESANIVTTANQESANIVTTANQKSANILTTASQKSANIVIPTNPESANIVIATNQKSSGIVKTTNQKLANTATLSNEESTKFVTIDTEEVSDNATELSNNTKQVQMQLSEGLCTRNKSAPFDHTTSAQSTSESAAVGHLKSSQATDDCVVAKQVKPSKSTSAFDDLEKLTFNQCSCLSSNPLDNPAVERRKRGGRFIDMTDESERASSFRRGFISRAGLDNDDKRYSRHAIMFDASTDVLDESLYQNVYTADSSDETKAKESL